MITRLPNHWLTIGRKGRRKGAALTEDNEKLIYLDMLAVEPTAEDLQYWLSSGETTDSLVAIGRQHEGFLSKHGVDHADDDHGPEDGHADHDDHVSPDAGHDDHADHDHHDHAGSSNGVELLNLFYTI